MMNDMRDRLVELIQNAVDGCASYWAELIADHLIANGVVVPPCKVGTTVYLPCLDDKGEIETYTITEFVLDANGLYFVVDDEDRETHSVDIIGKDCFFTKEQAKQKINKH